MNPRVKAVEVLEDCTLQLEFNNVQKGLFSMLPYLDYPVYKPLKDHSVFKQARVTMGFISWNEDIDMSPDNLYSESKMIA